MRIALVAPPFIPVPPVAYGGTELFIAHLAEGLCARGHDVVVYANGESRVACEVRSCYPQADWPPDPEANLALKSIDHAAWAIADVRTDHFDAVHLNDASTVPLSRFTDVPCVYTLHHPHVPSLSTLYQRYPEVDYVAISDAQRRCESGIKIQTIYHGLRIDDYAFEDRKEDYVCFLGRMAPVKAPHLAIAAARLAGVRLKLAGEIQPVFREYWDCAVAPGIDGHQIEYIGEADHAVKVDLLANARALLFPIQWEEPFGLVMIEAMACGTPVLALHGGAVDEVVVDGENGRLCDDVEEMAEWAADPLVDPYRCRRDAERRFSLERMTGDYEALYRRLARGGIGATAGDPAHA
ncbi:MAG TPA: glycosyltransferase family 4 protein [Vicinamibacterales bacterium]|nr:glycosyltransferase family 4 protein [Vicinamibacterales bacterium]